MHILRQKLGELNENVIKGEESSIEDFEKVGDNWTRPTFCVKVFFNYPIKKGNIAGYYTFPNDTKLIVDEGQLKKALEEFVKLPSYFKPDWQERPYSTFKTSFIDQSDFQIIPVFNITKTQSIEEILTTAGHLISEDMENRGPLYDLGVNGHENINLGYYKDNKDYFKVVSLERKKPEIGEPREYHIHESDVPRRYKINTHFLVYSI